MSNGIHLQTQTEAEFDPVTGKYFLKVRVWDNPSCAGDPIKELTLPQPFETKEAALDLFAAIAPSIMEKVEKHVVACAAPGTTILRQE